MFGDDAGPSDEVLPTVEPHAHGRRFGHAADHGTVRITVDNRIADDVNLDALELVERASDVRGGQPLALQKCQQLLGCDRGGSLSIRREEE